MAFEDFGMSHRKALEKAMEDAGEDKPLSYSAGVEVLAPAIIVHFMMEDLNIEGRDAWLLLFDKDTQEYSRWVAYKEILEHDAQRKADRVAARGRRGRGRGRSR